MQRGQITDVSDVHPVCIGSTHISKEIGAMRLGLTKPMFRVASNI